jgi:hypothetical protein
MNLLQKLLKKDDNFGIIIGQSAEFDLNGVQRYPQILRLNIENLLMPKPLLTQADPFLFVKGKTLYLFYESQRSGEKGIIRMMKTDNMNNWTTPVTVLQESFHLSFPFVFDCCGEVFMIPESQEADSIRLYKGNSDLTHFSMERVLMTKQRTVDVDFSFCDSHLLKKDGVFYLFTSVAYNWTYHLELYYTDDFLHHDFVKHPASPIYKGNDFGRSGGSIIHLDGNYYRISQNCSKSYGGNISVHRITALDVNLYTEELCDKDIIEVGGKIYRDGGHQLNVVKFDDKYIYATDFRHVSWCWYQLFLRLKKVFIGKI